MAPAAELYTGLLPKNNGVLANARKEKREGVRNIADHLIPLGYKVGLSGKKHFGLGTAEIDAIPGFASEQTVPTKFTALTEWRNTLSQAKRNGHSFCVIIGATHAHHPWDHGRESNFPTDQIELRPTTMIRQAPDWPWPNMQPKSRYSINKFAKPANLWIRWTWKRTPS